MQPALYHAALLALYWLLALPLIVALAMGTFALKTVPNSSPDKLAALQGHMIAAALYHQFVRRDGLLARMGFGPR